jgi:phage tail-like protein
MALDHHQLVNTSLQQTISSTFVPSAGENSAPLDGVAVMLVPDEIEIALQPPQYQQVERLQSHWHRVRPRPGLTISLQSLDNRPRIVHLAVQSTVPTWQSRWVKFSYVVRAVPELVGGEALVAQDVLSDDETSLTLLLQPGERREATLEFVAELDGETRTGDYPFDVVLTDVQEDACESSPGILRLRHPSSSFLTHLPGIYTTALLERDAVEENGPDGAFFGRFLRGFEDNTLPLDTLISHLHLFFGPRTAPPDFLPWLATWVALVLDENWPELKRRRLICEAVELYRWRGTRRGLMRYLEIYADVEPEINDLPYCGMRLGQSTLLGQNSTMGNVPPHTFVVTLAVPNVGDINEQTVRDIIESEKPAHTAYSLRIVPREAGREIQMQEEANETERNDYAVG